MFEHETSRRAFLGAAAFATATAALGSREAAAQTYDQTERGERDGSASNPGPDNAPLTRTNPDVYLPPPSDHGLPQNFWQSFSLSRRRIQEGGWARQINVHDFPISKDIAGVNMRLTSGGVRELHWHASDEWAIMLTGNCRLTAIDTDGRAYVEDVKRGDLWYFPAGIPHSLEGTGPDGCEFLLVFDDGAFSEDDTTLLTDWVKHVPREVLAKNFGLPLATVSTMAANLPEGGRYFFKTPPVPPLAQDRRAAQRGGPPTPVRFSFSMLEMAPQKATRSGSARIVDSTNFKVARNIAAAYVTVKPGGMRELHWHPNANEWQYYIAGKARMTVFFNHSNARTADFNPGDVGYVPQTFGHYVENTGDTDLVFLEMFRTDRYADISLNDWLTHLPPELVEQHLGISARDLDALPRGNYTVLPR